MIKRVFSSLKKALKNQTTTSPPQRGHISVNAGKYLISIPEDMSWAFIEGEYYETNVIYFFDKIVNRYDAPVLIDVGANYGYYSVKYSNACKKVFAFEPVGNTFEVLTKNIESNQVPNIFAFKNGLSNIEEERTINLYSSSGNNSIFEREIPPEHSLKKIGQEKIKLLVLDDLVKQGLVDMPDIIKIDVEGAELHVLQGAKHTIQQCRPTILLEYAESTSADAGYSRTALLDSLELPNYFLYGISENLSDCELIPQADFDKKAIANLIFSPTELQ